MSSLASATSHQITCRQVDFAYGPRTLLRDITFTVAPGDRMGIVAPNGAGKTTLLRLLAGELEPASGSIVTSPADTRVGLLRQQLDTTRQEPVLEFLVSATGTGDLVKEFEAAVQAVADGDRDADDRYDCALTRYLVADAASFDERAIQTLDQVGLASIAPDRPIDQLSGGQRTRLNLAATLLASFDVLLLDEPTNDLDAEGLGLLEKLVLTDERAMVVVSHDRTFLERVVTSVYELDEHAHTGTQFNGGFTAWQEARATAQRHHEEAYASYQSKRGDLQARAQTQQRWSVQGVGRAKKDKSEADKFIRAARIESSEKVASKAKQTERALERLDREEKVDAPWKPWELRLTFEPADRSGTEVCVLQNAVVARGDWQLGPVDAMVSAGDRILITGANGSGKTTLLRALLGEITLASGQHRLGPSVKIAELRQARELFPDASTLLRGFTDAVGWDDQAARSQLAKLGLDTERVNRPALELSPGEQTRAALGVFASLGSNLLVLDEPTNHLDLPAIEQLESALVDFPHTLLLVSHDRRLIENITTTRHWNLEAGGLVEK